MATRTEEEDFRTFRHNADPAAMGRVFDSVAPKLLLVAGHLSGDGGEAEDLVQTTILHAIRDAGRWDPERPLMPWLLGILSRRALDQRRRQATRATQPLEEQPGDIDTLELAANRELRESIARSVDALGEPYRQVLVLSVAHGLEPVEIAHALGRPPGTVRMQLKRGREQLRDALPRGVALPAMLLADTGGGLGAVRQRVLDGLTPLAAPTDDVPNHSPGSEAIQVTRTASPLGGWKAVYTAVGVSASIGAGVLLWSAITNDGGPSNRSLSDPGIVARISDPTAAVDLITPDSTPLAATRKTAQETRVPATEPTLRVTYERDGTPAVGVGLYLRELDGQQLASELRTDGGGFASVASLRHGRYRIDIDRGALPIDVELLPGSTIELKIRVGINVQGEVVDRTGTPVARARVLRLNPDHHDRLQWVATTGVRGEFSLPDVAPGTTFVARAAGYMPSSLGVKRWKAPTAEGQIGGVCTVRIVLGAQANQLAGRVLDASGQPVRRALVVLAFDEDAREEGRSSLKAPTGRGRPADIEVYSVRADRHGSFHTESVPSGVVMYFARSPHDAGSVASGWTQVLEGESNTVDIVLRQGARSVGSVLRADGQGLSGARVVAEWGGNQVGAPEHRLGALLADRETVTAMDGTYELLGLLPGKHTIYVVDAEGERSARERVTLDWDEEHQWAETPQRAAALVARTTKGGGGARSETSSAPSSPPPC